MDAVPRLPMLDIEIKGMADYSGMDWMDTPVESSKDNTAAIMAEQLKKYISENYMDDPAKYKDCIANFIELQAEAYKATRSLSFEGCNTLKKYYGQLHYMQSRFPFSGDNALTVPFTWCDSFTGIYRQHDSFAFEQTAIIFNLGACHSYLGSIDNRASDEGTRVSCVHFQCAAGFFQFLADHLDTTLAPDTSQFMLKLFINTMLGQGQECLLEKSMQDNRKDSIVAKISQQVVDYYKASLQSLNNQEARSNMGDSATKFWKNLISLKISYYSAISKYFMGCSSWDQGKYGEGVAYLGAAVSFHQEATKAAKNLKRDVKSRVEDALTYAADVIGGKYNSVKKDNDFVYHDRVPNKDTLDDVKGASLVKALQFDPTNTAVTGPDLFAKLVPMEAHLAASTYSEEKAKLLRTILQEVEEKDLTLDQFKQAIELDTSKLMKLDDDDRLDPVLLEHCAALSVDQTSIDDLKKAMKELSNCYMDIDSLLHESAELIDEEEHQSLSVKDTCGKTVESPEDLQKIKSVLNVCEDVHAKAGEMNDNLHTAVKTHIQNLKVVAEGLDAVKKYCGFQKMTDLLNDDDFEDISLMQKLCSKVKEMEEQRETLVSQLRKQLEEDDVTSSIVTKPGVDSEDLFTEELKKHDTMLGYIRQNLTAQENILSGVTEANVRYSKTKRVADNHKEKVATKNDQLLLSCTGYQEAIKKCHDATAFFKELLGKVSETNEQLTTLHVKNTKLRRELMEKWKAKQAPPRPSAPKPQAKPPASATPSAVGILSAEQLKEMADDMDDFDDPAFLEYLRMTGALGAAASANPSSARAATQLNRLPQSAATTAATRSHMPQFPNQPAHLPPHSVQSPQPVQHAPVRHSMPVSDANLTRFQPPIDQQSRLQPQLGLPTHGQPVSQMAPTPQRFAPPASTSVQAASLASSTPSSMGSHGAASVNFAPHQFPQQLPSQHHGHHEMSYHGNPEQQHPSSTVRHPLPERGGFSPGQNVPVQAHPSPPVHRQQSPAPHGAYSTPHPNYEQPTSTSQSAFPPASGASWNAAAPHQYVQRPTQSQPYQQPPQQQFGSGYHPGSQQMMRETSPRPAAPEQPVTSIASYQHPPHSAGVAYSGQAPMTTRPFMTPRVQQPSGYSQPPMNAPVSSQAYQPAQPIPPRGAIPQQNRAPNPYQPTSNRHPVPVPQVQQQPRFAPTQGVVPQPVPGSAPRQPGTSYRPASSAQAYQQPPTQHIAPQSPRHSAPQGPPVSRHSAPTQTYQPPNHYTPQSPVSAHQYRPPGPGSGHPYGPSHANAYSPRSQTAIPTAGLNRHPSAVQSPARPAMPPGGQPYQATYARPGTAVSHTQNPQTPSSHPLAAQIPRSHPPHAQTPVPRPVASLPNLPTPVQNQFSAAHQANPSQQHGVAQPPLMNASQSVAPRPAMQPLVPQVVGAVPKAPAPIEKAKPSEDLAGLTYTPSPILMPTKSNSADELLSGSPEPSLHIATSSKPVLMPTIVDDSEEHMVVRQIEDNPYDNEADLMQLKTDTEGFQRRVASLLVKEPGNLCPLDKDWKRLSELQEKHARQLSTAIGRCCSYKNRFQDILPFDQNRLVLKECKDDYINASLVDAVSPYTPRFIATQSPLPSTCSDFWTMIHEQQVTLIVMLASEADIPKKCAKYWPEDRNLPQKHGALSVMFTKSRKYETYIERIYTIKHSKSSLSHSLTQLQYTAWPDHRLPTSAHDLLEFIRVVNNFHGQQRNLQWPIVVHCENGVGHTGTFCVACTCVQELNAGLGIPDVLDIVQKIRCKRKYMVQEKAQLKFIYDVTHLHAVELLRQRGVKVEARAPSHQPPHVASPSQKTGTTSVFDVFGSGTLSSIQASVNKMKIRPLDKTTPPVSVSSVQEATSITNAQFQPSPTVADSSSPIAPSVPTETDRGISDLHKAHVGHQVGDTTPNAGVHFTNTSVMPDLLNSCDYNAQDKKQADSIAPSRGGNGVDPGVQLPASNARAATPDTSGVPQKPVSLLDQLTPEAFTLGQDVKERRKFTKADFSRLKDDRLGPPPSSNPDDPFGDIDPMWGVRK